MAGHQGREIARGRRACGGEPKRRRPHSRHRRGGEGEIRQRPAHPLPHRCGQPLHLPHGPPQRHDVRALPRCRPCNAHGQRAQARGGGQTGRATTTRRPPNPHHPRPVHPFPAGNPPRASRCAGEARPRWQRNLPPRRLAGRAGDQQTSNRPALPPRTAGGGFSGSARRPPPRPVGQTGANGQAAPNRHRSGAPAAHHRLGSKWSNQTPTSQPDLPAGLRPLVALRRDDRAFPRESPARYLECFGQPAAAEMARRASRGPRRRLPGRSTWRAPQRLPCPAGAAHL